MDQETEDTIIKAMLDKIVDRDLKIDEQRAEIERLRGGAGAGGGRRWLPCRWQSVSDGPPARGQHHQPLSPSRPARGCRRRCVSGARRADAG